MTLLQALKRYEDGYTDLETVNALIKGLQELKAENAQLRKELSNERL